MLNEAGSALLSVREQYPISIFEAEEIDYCRVHQIGSAGVLAGYLCSLPLLSWGELGGAMQIGSWGLVYQTMCCKACRPRGSSSPTLRTL